MSDQSEGNNAEIRDLLDRLDNLLVRINQPGYDVIDEDDKTEDATAIENIRTRLRQLGYSDNQGLERQVLRIPTYFYLGAVLESISQCLSEALSVNSAGGEGYLNIKYTRIKLEGNENLTYRPSNNLTVSAREGLGAGDIEVLSQEIPVYTTFEVPLIKESVISLLSDREIGQETSIQEFIKELLELAKEVIPQLNLTATYSNDSRVLTIFNFSHTTEFDNIHNESANLISNETFSENSNTFLLNYGSPNSLVENLILNARIDPAYMSSFRIVTNNTNISIDLINIIRNQNPDEENSLASRLRNILRSPYYAQRVNAGLVPSVLQIPIDGKAGIQSIDTRIKEDGSDVPKIYNTIFGSDDFDPVSNPGYVSVVSRWIQAAVGNDFDFQQQVISTLAESQSSVIQRLLNSFLLSVDATIHGTVGMSSFDHTYIEEYLPNIGGTYTITDIDDIITPSNFSTTLQMRLVKSNTDTD